MTDKKKKSKKLKKLTKKEIKAAIKVLRSFRQGDEVEQRETFAELKDLYRGSKGK